MGDELGLIKDGHLADLLLLDFDRLEQVKRFQDRAQIMAIMKDGAFHKAPATRP